MIGIRFATPATVIFTRRALGGILLAFGTAVMAAWLSRSATLSALAPDLGIMVFNTALCLALIGGGILLLEGAGAWQRWTLFALGAAVLALTGMTLVEHLARANLGVDLPDLHRWLQARAPAPGRMATGTCVALFLLGAALCLWPYARRRHLGAVIQALTIGAMVISLLGIMIREMQLQYLYSPYVFSGMALHTAIGIITASAGFWLAWHQAPWNRLLRFSSTEVRIKSSGTVILLAIAISTGFFGFYTSQDALEKNLVSSHMQTLRARVQKVETVIEHRLMHAGSIATHLDLQEQLHQINRNPGDASAKRRLVAIAESWVPLGFSGVAFHDAAGLGVAQAGKFVEQAAQVLPVGKSRRVRLSWSNGFHLRSEIDMFHEGQLAGRVIAEQLVPQLTEALLDLKDFGDTGDIELCAPSQHRASCFPTRLNSHPYTYPPVAEYQPYPAYRALRGETGHEFGLDYRGTPVFAAYAPVADFNLGMVVKLATSELTSPVRRQLENTLPIVALLVVMGIALLNNLVHPLAMRLARNEQQLKLALDNSSLALWDWDTRSNTMYLSEQWQAIMGGKPAATTTTFDAMRNLVHPDDAAALAKALRDTLKDSAAYNVEHRIRTHTGEWKWIHSVGNVVERDSRGQVLRMNGTNADIDFRKLAEEKLAHQAHHDALTGLPNRILFHDRLSQVMARARRHKSLMAVMYLDIDKFKNINDTLGHAMGDALLKDFARRLTSCVRAVDTVARLGGDEFAVILEQLGGHDDGCRIAEKIVAAMRPEFTLEYRTLTITTSVGVAFYQGADDIPPDQLVKKADEALYAAKGAGRNNYQVST